MTPRESSSRPAPAPDDRAVDAATAWAAAAAVPDPELPMVTIGGLGVLRDVTVDDRGRAHVQLTPTYTGCPAMEAIRADVVEALTDAGCLHVDVELVLSPPWSTDRITAEARGALAAAGIAPPPQRGETVDLALPPACPRCGSRRTRVLSRFGATACTALWVCGPCREPFTQVKTVR